MRGSRGIVGILLGLASGLAFGAGGAIVKPLLESGWSPGAAVFFRITVAAVLLAVPGLIALRFDLRPLWRAKWVVLIYSVIAVAGVQLAFYTAIARIPVSTALLIEYLAPVALVAFFWLRTRRAPQLVVLAGSVVAIAGLVLVIGPTGGPLDPFGVVIAGVAMLGVAVYYVLGERADLGVPPIALAAAGCLIGCLVLGAAALAGLVPFEVEFTNVDFFGGTTPWWVLVLMVGAISTAFAYVAGIQAIRMLGTRLSSFLGLSEVVFAAIVAWALLGEAVGPVQLIGGILILGGTTPWWVLVLMVGAISTAFAYVAGIQAIRMLGTRLSSFLGLSEVVFAAIVAWALLGEAIGPVQLIGGILILGGIVLVRMERAAPFPKATATTATASAPLPVPADRS